MRVRPFIRARLDVRAVQLTFIDVWVTVSSEASGRVLRPETASQRGLQWEALWQMVLLSLMLQQSCCSALILLLLSKFWLCVSEPVLVLLLSVIKNGLLSLPARRKGLRCVRGRLVFTVTPAGGLRDRWWLTAPLALQCYCCVMLFCCGVGVSVCLNLKSLEKCLLLLNIWS